MTTGTDQVLSVIRAALGARINGTIRICVALSGGMDSVVLLHAMARLRAETSFQLSALHVHHGLSPHADDWAKFCQALCASLQVPCDVVRLQLPEPTGKGLEQVAREARYAAFAAAPGDILCLAHHENDRAETFLLNLLRGAGATGLAGVPDTRSLGRKVLLRPLITLQRTELQAWAIAHQLRWIEDESNQNLAFRRNYVRHRILPAIVQKYPGAVGVLARTSAQMIEQASLLDRLATFDAQNCRDQDGNLSVVRLQQLPESALRNVLRHSLVQKGLQIPAARRLQEFAAQLMTAQTDTETFVRMGQVGLHLWRDRIWLDPAMDQSCPDAYPLQAGSVIWPDGQLEITGVPAEVDGLHIAPQGHGQRFHPAGRCRDRVSELLRAQGVPPWIRARLPGLWCQADLLWLPILGWAEQAEVVAALAPLNLRWQANTTLPL